MVVMAAGVLYSLLIHDHSGRVQADLFIFQNSACQTSHYGTWNNVKVSLRQPPPPLLLLSVI